MVEFGGCESCGTPTTWESIRLAMHGVVSAICHECGTEKLVPLRSSGPPPSASAMSTSEIELHLIATQLLRAVESGRVRGLAVVALGSTPADDAVVVSEMECKTEDRVQMAGSLAALLARVEPMNAGLVRLLGKVP